MKKIFTAIAVVAILMGANYLTNQGLRRLVLNLVDDPLASGYDYLGQARARIVGLFRIENIIRENQELEEENHQLKAANLKINELERENEFLRKELGVAKKKGLVLEIARIFHFNADGLNRTAFIDKGSEDGLKTRQPVIFGGDILLGIVREVYPRNALVYLINDPRVALNVKIVDSMVVGRTRGGMEQGLWLELVTNQEDVKEGQMVVTNGLDGLPSSLLVGKISHVQTKSGELFKTVRIDTEFNNLFLENVFVLKN